MKDFEFIIVTAVDKDCIGDFHKAIAKGLINKHGCEVMSKVLELLETNPN